MIYACCDPGRRSVLATRSDYNGIDFIEVVDGPGIPESERQRTLRVYFIRPLEPDQLDIRNVTITGGERIRNVAAVSVYEDGFASPPGDPLVLVVVVNVAGDFSRYTLRLVDPSDTTRPPQGFDQILSSIDFSFKAACPTTLDCQPLPYCPLRQTGDVDISYLAKDYASLRALMLDRLAITVPRWQETHPADLGMMLVEWLAFIGDYLSYQQDAVATEAYLRTARRRTSLRRLVRLVDYPMHDGRNARGFVHFDVRADVEGLAIAPGTQVLTLGSQPGVVLPLGSTAYTQAINEGARVFELMPRVPPLSLYAEHNRIRFYSWGDRECCLPAGSTSAWLRGPLPNLRVGDVLIFQEIKGPNTGEAGDSDPAHRCAVMLTAVGPDVIDPIGGEFDSPPTSQSVTVTPVQWSAADALPFPLCLSTPDFDDVSVALGNIAMADHGRMITGEVLPAVPSPNPALTIAAPVTDDRCSHPPPVTPKPARFNPGLAQSPLTFADGYAAGASANVFLNSRSVSDLTTPVNLTAAPGGDHWQAATDLLKAGAAMLFVAEVEDDGTAILRFGDGQYGAAPPAGTIFTAQYRVGNGTEGNVGAESLCRIATTDGAILSDTSVIAAVTNPLPAIGGLDPEPLDNVRQSAPYAFRTQERAVTETDYGSVAVTLVDPTLAKAMGTFRWTGSWRTMFVSVDPEGNEQVADTQRELIKTGFELYRMAGHDVEVAAPIYVSIDLEMTVCVKPGYLTSHVRQALLDVLSNRVLPDGTLGLFHPDNFTFGQTIYLSPVYARVQDTLGVAFVEITKFSRQGQGAINGVAAGQIVMDRLEMGRLDNDPNFPERGVLILNVQGAQ